MKLRLKKRGQALVEFALFATLLMMMLSAIVDLGLAFFAHQGLSGAALEGVTYVSGRSQPGTETAEVDREGRRRVHFEAGVDPNLDNRAIFVDLMDLDNNGAIDAEGVLNQYITIQSLPSTNATSSVNCAQRQRDVCDIRLTVRYNFRAKFFMATIFGLENFELRATRQMTLR